MLLRGELSPADLPAERIRYLEERGIVESGRKVRLVNRFVARIASAREHDVSGARMLFELPKDFAANIRTVLELRLAQAETTGDPDLLKLIRRAVKHLPDEPAACIGNARDILDRALDAVWAVEAPGDRVPPKWIGHWRDTEISTGRRIPAASEYAQNAMIPEERGRQCALLRIATGQHRVRPIASHASKVTYVFIEHMSQVGDLKNHSKGEPTLTMEVAFCMAAIELAESLGRDLGA